MIAEIVKNRMVKGCLQSHTPFMSVLYAFLTISYASIHSTTLPFTPIHLHTPHTPFISRRALAREGDYKMMPVCVCVR